MVVTASYIEQEICERCKSYPNVIAVLTMGSCARGEETYFVNESGDSEMMSDYEMLIIINMHNAIQDIENELRDFRNELLSISHSNSFDLEWRYKTIHEIKRIDKRFISFEAVTSGRVVYGDTSILDSFPNINIKNLNYSELNTIIIHRLYHVLRDLHTNNVHYKKYLIARNSLDFSTAILPLAGILVSSYNARITELQKFATRYQLPPDLLKRQSDYYIMKRNYSSDLYDKYSFEEMLKGFYLDFQLLKSMQMQLQGGVLFRTNRRRMLSAVYRRNTESLKICLQWRKRLTSLCERMFDIIRHGVVQDNELEEIKTEMKELFGYC